MPSRDKGMIALRVYMAYRVILSGAGRARSSAERSIL